MAWRPEDGRGRRLRTRPRVVACRHPRIRPRGGSRTGDVVARARGARRARRRAPSFRRAFQGDARREYVAGGARALPVPSRGRARGTGPRSGAMGRGGDGTSDEPFFFGRCGHAQSRGGVARAGARVDARRRGGRYGVRPSAENGPRRAHPRGRGFLVVFGAIRASAPGDSPAAVHIDGVRARATRSDERVRVAALLDPAAADELPGVAPRLVAESPPAFLVVAAFRAKATTLDGSAYAADVPLVSVTASPSTVALAVDAAKALETHAARARRRMSRKWRRLGASSRRGILLEAASPGAVRKSFSGRHSHPRTLRRRLRGSSPHHPGVAVSRSVSSDRTRAATRWRRRPRRRRF